MDDGDDDDPLPLMEDSDGADSPKPHDGNDQIARSQSPQQQAQGESTEPQNDRASADPAQSRGTKAERRARRQRESSDDVLILECPHCQGTVQILALNCRIFRHGAFKRSGMQIPPHASQAECEMWLSRNAVDGCAKPFRVVQVGDKLVAEVCDYI
eukprot:TRINITY_DN2519_c0_g1_i1.p1 TRINITY_DN2519_c0_g1~~TRINITY_DN2519_c0_g1_i1.p1  ORF type:complete len:156 (+),score=20.31 TRINITY_DN2519_c0_g1_i1:72-539(+)